VLPIIEEIERAGITSHNAIAAKLNERNVRTARGGKWTHVQVGAVLRPFAEAAAPPKEGGASGRSREVSEPIAIVVQAPILSYPRNSQAEEG
jgi:hypothetical protein